MTLTEKKHNISDDQIVKYLELVERRLFILLHSGVDWKPEYESELATINQELADLRPLVEQEHERRGGGAGQVKQVLNVRDVMEALEVSESKAYGIIKKLNQELEAKGYIVVRGKISRVYFEEKLYGIRATPG